MAGVHIRDPEHRQHIKVGRFKFICSEQIFYRLIESIDLILEFGGGDLRLEIVGLLTRLLHRLLHLHHRLLRTVA